MSRLNLKLNHSCRTWSQCSVRNKGVLCDLPEVVNRVCVGAVVSDTLVFDSKSSALSVSREEATCNHPIRHDVVVVDVPRRLFSLSQPSHNPLEGCGPPRRLTKCRAYLRTGTRTNIHLYSKMIPITFGRLSLPLHSRPAQLCGFRRIYSSLFTIYGRKK